MALHPLLRLLYDRLFTVGLDGSKGSGKDFQAVRAKTRVAYDLIFAVLFMIVLHGVSAPKILLILYVNFTVATRLPTSAVPLATWAFNMTILFANELCHGYPYSWLAEYVPFGTAPNGAKLYVDVGQRLDSYGGLVSQWQVLFKITILRLISFNLDYYWSIKNGGTQAIEVSLSAIGTEKWPNRPKKKQLDPSLLSERERVSTPASPEAYKFRNYLAYVLYSPLYLAGPIITFNDYTTQLRHRPASIQPGRTALYGFRFLLTLLTMELILHFIYAVAISKSDPDWSQYSPFQISMLGFFNLHIIWLKLLLPWRFFRLWALIDGIDPPENMVRCMSNNYSALAFWRGWHRSYNKWVVRYLFIPLGGSGRHTSFLRGLGNTLVVFTFVALWHDINRRLLWWSWLVVLFLMPELICSTVLFPARNYRDKPETYRVLSGIGAVANVLMMMAANLVGFALGVDGLQSMIKGLVSGWEGFAFFGAACTVLFVGVMVMFEIREDERRRGIDLKC